MATDDVQDQAPERLFNWDNETSLGTAVGEAIGLGSVCWDQAPAGVFNVELAGRVVNELLEFLSRQEAEILQAARREWDCEFAARIQSDWEFE